MNIDALDDSMDTNSYLSDYCDTFSLKNLILGKICFEAVSGTSVDIMLRNGRGSFLKTTNIETGLSDHHKLIVSLGYHLNISLGYHLKKLNTETIKNLIWKVFFMNLIKRY